MLNFTITAVVLIYVFMSAFLETSSGSRVTTADLILVAIIAASGVKVIVDGLYISKTQTAVLPLLLIFLIAALGANYVDRATFELLIITFNFLGSLALVNVLLSLPEIWLRRFFAGYVLTLGILALICLIDFLIMPGLISSRALGGLQGPFRNTGQSGSFFGVHFALACSLIVGGIVPRRPLFIFATVCVLFALIFTLKRSSNLALIIGVIVFVFTLLFSRSVSDKKYGLIFSGIGLVAVTVCIWLFEWALEVVPRMKNRWDRKFSSDTIESFSNGFFADNVASAFDAFDDKPLFGVGLDNVRGVYQYHEIHSTYLGILAYGGLLGVLAYILFMGTLFRSMYSEAKYKRFNPWAAFLYMLLPLLVGLMVGWAYTIHIRKREFWLLVVFVIVAVRLSQKARQSMKQFSIKSIGLNLR